MSFGLKQLKGCAGFTEMAGGGWGIQEKDQKSVLYIINMEKSSRPLGIQACNSKGDVQGGGRNIGTWYLKVDGITGKQGVDKEEVQEQNPRMLQHLRGRRKGETPNKTDEHQPGRGKKSGELEAK